MSLWSDDMRDIINKIIDNNALFAGIIIFLCAVLITLIILIIRSMRDGKKINIYEEELEDEDIKKVKHIKKEDIIETPDDYEDIYDDVEEEDELPSLEELETVTEEEIEERYDAESEKEAEEILEDNPSTEIEKLVKELEQTSKLSPEDIVEQFEREQEAQSIISYQELVAAVRDRKDEYYEDELESRPLTTVSDFIREKQSVEESLKEDKEEDKRPLRTEVDDRVVKNEEVEEKRFHQTEVISPIYGRIDTHEPSKVKEEPPSYEDETSFDEETSLDDIYSKMAEDLDKSLEQTSALEDLTKNEEFLQTLKDFRKKL